MKARAIYAYWEQVSEYDIEEMYMTREVELPDDLLTPNNMIGLQFIGLSFGNEKKGRKIQESNDNHKAQTDNTDMREGLVLARERFTDAELVKIDAALSEPPYNCDVGSAEEQHNRIASYCDRCDCGRRCHMRRREKGEVDDTNG